MTLQCERIKYIGIRAKFVVNGFIREIELEILSIQTFDKISFQHIQTGSDNNTITKNGDDYDCNNTSYGKDWIDSVGDDIYVFSIRINFTQDGGNIGVGFVTNSHQ